MREYYLEVKITCDECGCSDYLSNDTLTEEDLESHVEKYYVKKDGKDFCLDCIKEEK